MKTKSQTGFTLIEGLLVLIAVVLIAFTGFYIYNANKNTAQLVSKGTATNATVSSAKPATRFLKIKELGIEIPLTAKLNSVEYSIPATDSTVADLTTKSFQDAVAACKAPDTASSSLPVLGFIAKVNGQYDSMHPPVDVFATFVKQFPDFYLTYGAPDGGYCNGGSTAQRNAVNTIFKQISIPLKQAATNAKQI